ncbi:MAG TPA: carboxymuconolactone decarboxylase family protein [Flavipsychrobacter sp.]
MESKERLNATAISLLEALGIDDIFTSPSLEQLAATDSKYLRDLKLNVTGVLKSKNLSSKEAALLALVAVVNEKNATLITAFEKMAGKEGATAEEISETHACASLLSLNNVFYRFRHYMKGNEYYNNTPAGIRMSIMMAPAMGKELFELMSLAVSALNGCEQCVTSHEHSVREVGASEAKIYDTVRLVAVIKSLCVVI